MKTIDVQLPLTPGVNAIQKRTRVFYWIATGLLALLMFTAGLPDLLVVPDAVTMFKHLGYPVYLLPFLGVAKILSVTALVQKRFNTVKEWAYAGITFDLLGAFYSGLAAGDSFASVVPALIGLLLTGVSYRLWLLTIGSK